MFKQLAIKFFQSHRNTTLNFSPYFNCIYGEPCHGKTAIFRALLLLKDNRPAGFKFNSWFSRGEPTEVSILTAEGIRIHFQKSKKTEYRISGYDSPFNPGRDVPKEVTEILNFGPMNIQKQLDQTFMITDTPGKIAQRLNKIIQKEDVDKWVSEITKQIKVKNKEKDFLKTERIEIRDQLRQMPDLKAVGEKIKAVRRYEEKLYTLEDKYHSIQQAFREYKAIKKSLHDLPIEDLKKQFRRITKLVAWHEGYRDLLSNLVAHKQLLKEIKSIKEDQLEAKKKHDRLYEKLDRCPTCGGRLTDEQRNHLCKGE